MPGSGPAPSSPLAQNPPKAQSKWLSWGAGVASNVGEGIFWGATIGLGASIVVPTAVGSVFGGPVGAGLGLAVGIAVAPGIATTGAIQGATTGAIEGLLKCTFDL